MRDIKYKKLIILFIILLILLIFFITKYSINNNYISNYYKDEYNVNSIKKLLFLNIQEKYIAHFNYGTSLYQTEQYTEARDEFSEALKTVPKSRICDVRVNISLCDIQLLEKNTDVKNIESIQKILLGNDCANDSHTGKDKKAQDLYDLLEEYKNNSNQEEITNNDDSGENNSNTEDEVIENEKDKINQIKENKKNAANGRNPANERDYNVNNYKDAVW